MSLPAPEPGLVIRYAYLWRREFQVGRDEAAKDRPCAIVLTARHVGESLKVLVVPVTHSPPESPADALELPPAVKAHLGLDADRSWVVLTESNVFTWPGPDLRRIDQRRDASVAYGFLPPRFFQELRRRFLALEAAARTRRIQRTE